MSASQSPELSDIHPGPTTVAETLQVTTEPPTISIGSSQLAGAVSDTHSAIPAVGASISVPETSAAGIGGVERSSTALLNLASNSLSLTEILNAQQQALEQFQCQLQLAQQTEAINQRLDAIERTLNSLIQQKAQEDAEKHQKQQEQAAAEQQAQQQQVGHASPPPSLALPCTPLLLKSNVEHLCSFLLLPPSTCLAANLTPLSVLACMGSSMRALLAMAGPGVPCRCIGQPLTK